MNSTASKKKEKKKTNISSVCRCLKFLLEHFASLLATLCAVYKIAFHHIGFRLYNLHICLCKPNNSTDKEKLRACHTMINDWGNMLHHDEGCA